MCLSQISPTYFQLFVLWSFLFARFLRLYFTFNPHRFVQLHLVWEYVPILSHWIFRVFVSGGALGSNSLGGIFHFFSFFSFFQFIICN